MSHSRPIFHTSMTFNNIRLRYFTYSLLHIPHDSIIIIQIYHIYNNKDAHVSYYSIVLYDLIPMKMFQPNARRKVQPENHIICRRIELRNVISIIVENAICTDYVATEEILEMIFVISFSYVLVNTRCVTQPNNYIFLKNKRKNVFGKLINRVYRTWLKQRERIDNNFIWSRFN